MTIKTIYIARHGYRSNWLPAGPYPEPPTGIENDVPLAVHGLEQAEERSKYIETLAVKPEIAFTSPFYRCLQTVQPIKQALNIPLYVDRGLGEWFKPDRDVIPKPADNALISEFFPCLVSEGWEDSIVPSLQGETEEDIFIRCKAFWPIFIRNVEKKFPEVESVILVTHAATKAALGMNLLKFPNARMGIDEKGTMIRNGSCSLDRYDLTRNGGEDDFYSSDWKLVMNGNTSFLSKGEEMNWDFKNRWEAGSDADIKSRKHANIEISNAEVKSKLE